VKRAIIMIWACALLSATTVHADTLPPQDTYYSIQFMSLPISSLEKGRTICERLKSRGYLVYYLKVNLKGTDRIRLKAGLFPTVTDAKTFGDAFRQKENFDFFVTNADVKVMVCDSTSELIATPNALWYGDDQGYRELIRFDHGSVDGADVLDRTVVGLSADGSKATCTRGSRRYDIPLATQLPPEKSGEKEAPVDEGNAETYYESGLAFYKQEKLALAERDLSRALLIDPEHVSAYYYRGIARYRQGRYDQAIADCTRILEIDPRHVGAYNIRALVWLETGELDRAVKDCDAALKVDPQNIAALSTLGVAWLQKGEVDWACSDLKKACDLGRCDTLETVRKQGFCQ